MLYNTEILDFFIKTLTPFFTGRNIVRNFINPWFDSCRKFGRGHGCLSGCRSVRNWSNSQLRRFVHVQYCCVLCLLCNAEILDFFIKTLTPFFTGRNIVRTSRIKHKFTNGTVFSVRTFLIDSVAHGLLCIFYYRIKRIFSGVYLCII